MSDFSNLIGLIASVVAISAGIYALVKGGSGIKPKDIIITATVVIVVLVASLFVVTSVDVGISAKVAVHPPVNPFTKSSIIATAIPTNTPVPTVVPTNTPAPTVATTPTSQLLYKEDFVKNTAEWSQAGFTVNSDNSIVCTSTTGPCSQNIDYVPPTADYVMYVTIQFLPNTFGVVCLKGRVNDSSPEGTSVEAYTGQFGSGQAVFQGCEDSKNENTLGYPVFDFTKEFTMKITLSGASLSIHATQQASTFDKNTSVQDTSVGKLSIFSNTKIRISNVSIYG